MLLFQDKCKDTIKSDHKKHHYKWNSKKAEAQSSYPPSYKNRGQQGCTPCCLEAPRQPSPGNVLTAMAQVVGSAMPPIQDTGFLAFTWPSLSWCRHSDGEPREGGSVSCCYSNKITHRVRSLQKEFREMSFKEKQCVDFKAFCAKTNIL